MTALRCRSGSSKTRRLRLGYYIATLIAFSTVGTALTSVQADIGDRLGALQPGSWSALDSIGANWVRLAVTWGGIETSQNRFSWQGMDNDMNAATARGMVIMPIIKSTSNWATLGSGSTSTPPRDLRTSPHPDYAYSRDYYDFIYRFVDRYRNDLVYLTIENEANTNLFWGGTANEYIRLLATAYKAAHDAKPNIRVTDAGMASRAWGLVIARDLLEAGKAQDALRFANSYYAQSGKHWNSVSALNNYIYSSSFNREQYDKIKYYFAHFRGILDAVNIHFYEDPWHLDDVLKWVRVQLNRSGANVPYRISNEAGIRRAGYYNPSRTQFALDVIKQIAYGMDNKIEAHAWFMRDGANNQYGLMTDNLNWRPGAYAFEFLGDKLASGYDTVERIDSTPNTIRFRFSREGAAFPVFEILWWDNGSHGNGSTQADIFVPQGTRRATKFDYRGIPSSAGQIRNGRIRLFLTEDPMMIEFEP